MTKTSIRLKIDALEVKSFVTSLSDERERTAQGGASLRACLETADPQICFPSNFITLCCN